MNTRRASWLMVLLSSLAASCGPSIDSTESDRTGENGTALSVQGPILRSRSRVPEQYIVVLKGDPERSCGGNVGGVASALARRYQGSVLQVYQRALCGFSVHMAEPQAQILAADPAVAYIEEDGTVSLATTQYSAPWGLDRIDQRALPLSGSYTYPVASSNVYVYVIDTGIRTTHAEFGGRAYGAFTSIPDGNGTSDCAGHGTHVAGIIGGSTYGVAKSSRLYSVRVLGCNGSGTISGVIAGVDWVTQYHTRPAIANMSLVGAASQSLDTAVTNSINAGVTYVVAASNNGSDACAVSPARVGPALTVGATNSNDSRAAYSSIGTCLDLFAPGTGITSAWYTSDAATSVLDGTSMASPHVAGAAALYLASNPQAMPYQVAQALLSNATAGAVSNAGAGSPNRLLYMGPFCVPRTTCYQNECGYVSDGCGGTLECSNCNPCGLGYELCPGEMCCKVGKGCTVCFFAF